MNAKLNLILAQAENRYLTASEIQQLRQTLTDWRLRLEIYERLRERELGLWETVARQIHTRFGNIDPDQRDQALALSQLLLHILGKVMLFDYPESLAEQEFSWILARVRIYQVDDLVSSVMAAVHSQLGIVLGTQGLATLEPYFQQIRAVMDKAPALMGLAA